MANSTIKKEQIRDIPLTVMESDGSPSVYPIDTIKFSGLTVTDLGGGDALVAAIPPSGTTLTVMESDGSPSVVNVDTIKFSGAVVTNLGNGDVLIIITGSGLMIEEDDKIFATAMAVAL